jgi:hypothetical protein
MTTIHFATLVGAAAATLTVAWAPVAAAETNQPQQSCQSAGQSSTVCQSPGNVEVKAVPPPVTFYPYGSPPPTAG